jgi:hypothetical protein
VEWRFAVALSAAMALSTLLPPGRLASQRMTGQRDGYKMQQDGYKMQRDG